ncbi:MAG: universal stress protein [Paenibacillaceae bacterium]
MIFSNILVAYDSSKQSRKALEQAVLIAEQSPDIKLLVLHVYEIPQYIIGEAIISASVRVETDLYEHSSKLIGEAQRRIAHLPHASTTLLQGNTSKVILDKADEMNCDVIIMGSRGLGGFKELILGSVSNNVVQHSKIPVLIIK